MPVACLDTRFSNICVNLKTCFTQWVSFQTKWPFLGNQSHFLPQHKMEYVYIYTIFHLIVMIHFSRSVHNVRIYDWTTKTYFFKHKIFHIEINQGNYCLGGNYNVLSKINRKHHFNDDSFEIKNWRCVQLSFSPTYQQLLK